VPIVAKTEQYCSILDVQLETNQKVRRGASPTTPASKGGRKTAGSTSDEKGPGQVFFG
jgi:hypothetical protein